MATDGTRSGIAERRDLLDLLVLQLEGLLD
jgi:hypothetical protein